VQERPDADEIPETPAIPSLTPHSRRRLARIVPLHATRVRPLRPLNYFGEISYGIYLWHLFEKPLIRRFR
jgi:hypothetical protein